MRLHEFTRRTVVQWSISIAAAAVLFLALGAEDGELLFRINRSIDLFGKVYREIAVQHVDGLDPERLMRSGIDGMLKGLDPYTVFIDEEGSDEIDLVTTGRYGGIGVSIGVRDGAVVIVNLLEGFTASKQGLRIGDRIVEVEGSPVSTASVEQIRRLVRGSPGTEVRMKIEREGESAPLDFVLVREEIPVRNISYAGYAAPGVAYVRLERFSRTAGDDLRSSLKDLKSTGEIKGVILDLRDNPGGLLDIAVDVVAKFVPESSLVVSTRGRKPETERKYFSTEQPMLPDIPLAVLVNENSASASEIVAGAIQDLDRGVIVGTRTFGKGLVQTISRLTETASLKITTARYYTPSGRCIQELDYAHRTRDGEASVVPDSLRRLFQTRNHRPVLEAGGIHPDTLVPLPEAGPLIAALVRKAMFFKYANYLASQGRLDVPFAVTNKTVDEFDQYLSLTRFQYEEDTESALKELRKIATDGRYEKSFLDEITSLERMTQQEKKRSVARYRAEIRTALEQEILGRSSGDKARIEASLKEDPQVLVTLGLLKNKAEYARRLRGK